jgi:uncharacterized protein (TIGR02246 family)
MTRFSRDEMEAEFEAYQERGRVAGQTGDWNAWADQFTPDAVYVEHLFGRFEGREAIREWITSTMSQFPNDQFVSFPIEWAVFDTDRGWIVCEIQNRMTDPGDGSIHQAPNFTRLVYAGDGQWSYEEDVYNPQSMADVFQAWLARKREIEAAQPGI